MEETLCGPLEHDWHITLLTDRDAIRAHCRTCGTVVVISSRDFVLSGYRLVPSESPKAEDQAALLEATRLHLEDMRKIGLTLFNINSVPFLPHNRRREGTD